MIKQEGQIVLTVSQLTQALKLQLESLFPHVLMKGEVSNLKLQSSGHLYFTLKDENAQISCVMFRMQAMKLPAPLKIGDQVIVTGQVTVYPPRGNYQLIVKDLSLLGLGELLLKYELLKQKLEKKGWFSQEHKKQLPPFPKTIGVITSPTGAVIRDIITVLTRRLQNFHLILNPVRVQGEGAAPEIIQAINEFNKYSLADVIIVARGGGSFEDFAPFNDEKVAEAIFNSKIPIISAVGHETDTSISDFVADVRAPTPSAAAEIVSIELEQYLAKLEKFHKMLHQLTKKNFHLLRTSIIRFSKNPVLTSAYPLLRYRIQMLDEYRDNLDTGIKRTLEKYKLHILQIKRYVEQAKPESRVKEGKSRLLALSQALKNSIHSKLVANRKTLGSLDQNLSFLIQRIVSEQKHRFTRFQFEKEIPNLILRDILNKKRSLTALFEHLTSLHPDNLLKKGYTILFSQKDGSVITNVAHLSKGDDVVINFYDGKAEAEIKKVILKNHEE